jgi:hypothetical protein
MQYCESNMLKDSNILRVRLPCIQACIGALRNPLARGLCLIASSTSASYCGKTQNEIMPYLSIIVPDPREALSYILVVQESIEVFHSACHSTMQNVSCELIHKTYLLLVVCGFHFFPSITVDEWFESIVCNQL